MKYKHYTFTRDSAGWTLKDGSKQTYYGWLEHVFNAIADREAGKCSDLDELRATFKELYALRGTLEPKKG